MIKSALLLLFSIFGSAVVGSVADNAIGEDTHITLGSAIACMMVVISCTAWLSRYYYKQGQMHKDNLKRFEAGEQNQERLRKLIIKICHRLNIETDLEP